MGDAKEYAGSPEARAHLDTAKLKARMLAEPDAARQAITVGLELSDEILGHLVEGDSPTQAAAKAAKRRMGPVQPGAINKSSHDGELTT